MTSMNITVKAYAFIFVVIIIVFVFFVIIFSGWFLFAINIPTLNKVINK